jgi:hypothetical protein
MGDTLLRKGLAVGGSGLKRSGDVLDRAGAVVWSTAKVWLGMPDTAEG